MKILLLMKRFSTNRDMIMENVGREVRLFSEINRLGHNVTILCADQTKKERKTTKLNGMPVEIYPFGLANTLKYAAKAIEKAAANDIVVGATHPLLGYIAMRAARRNDKKMVYDIRDNYEAYNFTNLPLLKKGILPRLINNRIIRNCDLAVCAGDELMRKVIRARRNRPVAVVPNGANTALFKHLDKQECRKKLSLPLKPKIIVYTGHLSKERGTDILIEAFKLVRQKYPEAILLLSGQKDKAINIDQPGIEYMDLPRRKDVALAINAADVAVVPHPENDATRYGIPYKLLEYMACNARIVATAVGDVKGLLAGHNEILAQPGNMQDLAAKLMEAIEMPGKADYSKIIAEYTWEKLARKLNTELVKLKR